MIPSKEEISIFKKAGHIAQTCLQRGAKLIKPGANMVEVLDKIEDDIRQMGGKPAFPAQISLNSIAAHFCPTNDDNIIFKEGDIAKLDIGVHIDGHIADNALTVDLGDNKELTKASKDALAAALSTVGIGVSLGDVGKAIQDAITSYDFRPIRNLSGHGLGKYQIHTKPNIPNVNTHDDTPLKEGQVIAIEPFASSGAGLIFESSNPTIFSHVRKRPVRSPLTKSVLRSIAQFEGLPFTTRWLTKEHPVGKVNYALRELQANGSIIAHPPLPDRDKGMVSQHEHSVIIMDKPIVYTKLDD